MKVELIDKNDYYELSLISKVVTQLIIDYRFSFIIYDKTCSVQICLMTPFKYKSSDGKKYLVDPEKIEEISPLLKIFKKEISQILIYKNSDLIVSFSDKAQIEIKPSSEYEAWEMSAENGLKVVCVPGGKELYIWNSVQLPRDE